MRRSEVVRRVLTALAGLLCVAVAALPARLAAQGTGDEHYAVIVHRNAPRRDLSLDELRRIFLGEQQFWSGGAKVVLFVPAPGATGRDVLLRNVYQMNEGQFKRYWIAKVFRDDVASGPKIVSTSTLARQLTAKIPGAVAIIPASEVDDTVKVLSVAGREPGDDQYPLARRTPAAEKPQ